MRICTTSCKITLTINSAEGSNMKITNILKLSKHELSEITLVPEYRKLIPVKTKYLINAYTSGLSEMINSYYMVEKTVNDEDKSEKSTVSDFVQTLHEEIFKCTTPDGSFFTGKSKLQSHLLNLKQTELLIIKGVKQADSCGQIWYTSNDNFFIETAKGELPGIWEAQEIPSYYVMDDSEKTISFKENNFSKYYILDTDTYCYQLKTDKNTEKVTIDETTRKALCNMFRIINREKLNIKTSWIISENRIFIQDIYMPIGTGILE